jgi:hypothetical protein
MVAHITLLNASASIQGRGEEYFRAGPHVALASQLNGAVLPVPESLDWIRL